VKGHVLVFSNLESKWGWSIINESD